MIQHHSVIDGFSDTQRKYAESGLLSTAFLEFVWIEQL